MQVRFFFYIRLCLWAIFAPYPSIADLPKADRLFAEGLWEDARLHYEQSIPPTPISPLAQNRAGTFRQRLCLAFCYSEQQEADLCLHILASSTTWGPSFYLYVKALRETDQTKRALQALLFSSTKQIASSPLFLHAFVEEACLACSALFPPPSSEELQENIATAKRFFRQGYPRLSSPPPLSNPYLFYAWGLKESSDHWEQLFPQLLAHSPDSPIAPSILFSLASSASIRKADEKARAYLQQILIQYPSSPLAPYAYFQQYPLSAYASGEKDALAHLRRMEQLFPQSPLILSAHYLTGLAYLRDHYSEKGRLLRSRNLVKAIDSFQQTEFAFEALSQKNLIPPEQLAAFSLLRFRAWHDRCLANLSIGETSSGTKKTIYLQYALQALQELLQALPATQDLSSLREEVLFYLAKSHLAAQQQKECEKNLHSLFSEAEENSLWRIQGYVLQAVLLKKEFRYKEALQFLERVEMHPGFCSFTQEERLQLWMEKSLSLRETGEYGESMKWLSRIINEEVASQKRIEAMLLRADLYKRQGRKVFALRQLEAVMQKGGRWGQQAKEAWDAIQLGE